MKNIPHVHWLTGYPTHDAQIITINNITVDKHINKTQKHKKI